MLDEACLADSLANAMVVGSWIGDRNSAKKLQNVLSRIVRLIMKSLLPVEKMNESDGMFFPLGCIPDVIERMGHFVKNLGLFR